MGKRYYTSTDSIWDVNWPGAMPITSKSSKRKGKKHMSDMDKILSCTNPYGHKDCTHGTIGRVILPADVAGQLWGAAGAYAKPVDLAANGIQIFVPTAQIADAAAHHFPGTVHAWRMRDYGCWPVELLAKRAERLAKYVRAGYRVCVACHGGHGRTGTLLAATAIALGVAGAIADPVAWIRANYCKCAVESAEQESALQTLAAAAATNNR